MPVISVWAVRGAKPPTQCICKSNEVSLNHANDIETIFLPYRPANVTLLMHTTAIFISFILKKVRSYEMDFIVQDNAQPVISTQLNLTVWPICAIVIPWLKCQSCLFPLLAISAICSTAASQSTLVSTLVKEIK